LNQTIDILKQTEFEPKKINSPHGIKPVDHIDFYSLLFLMCYFL